MCDICLFVYLLASFSSNFMISLTLMGIFFRLLKALIKYFSIILPFFLFIFINSRWQTEAIEPEETRISHNVTNFEFLYEPFYVANDVVPPHDERFVGYGYTRNTQVRRVFKHSEKFVKRETFSNCYKQIFSRLIFDHPSKQHFFLIFICSYVHKNANFFE